MKKKFNNITNPAEAIIKGSQAPIENEPHAEEFEEELKSRRVQLLVRPSTYAEIKRRAVASRTSVNNFINELMEKEIETPFK